MDETMIHKLRSWELGFLRTTTSTTRSRHQPILPSGSHLPRRHQSKKQHVPSCPSDAGKSAQTQPQNNETQRRRQPQPNPRNQQLPKPTMVDKHERKQQQLQRQQNDRQTNTARRRPSHTIRQNAHGHARNRLDGGSKATFLKQIMDKAMQATH